MKKKHLINDGEKGKGEDDQPKGSKPFIFFKQQFIAPFLPNIAQ